MNKNSKLETIFCIIGVFVTLAAAFGAVVYFLEKKKKKDDEELQDYLENSIQ